MEAENETYLSTQHSSTSTSAWLPPSNVKQSWTLDHPSTSCQRPAQAERLIDSCNQRTDFDLLKRATRFSGQHYWMMFSPDVKLRCPRVAYAIGRNYGNAVQRNRVRRQSRSILRSHASSMPKGRYLIGAVKSIPRPSFSDLEADLSTLISKVNASK